LGAIELDGVTKRFPDGTVAVNDLKLKINDGEFMIFVGPSGCGKTTALRMVAGLEELTEGRITIGGRLVNGLEPRERDIAMVFQSYALYPQMRVVDNIAFPLRMRKVPKQGIQERVAEAGSLLELDTLLHRKPRALSGGQRQRVAMGRAIVRHPQAFLMDEPLSNLDAKLRVQMRAQLAKLHRRLGVTTLYVTHDQTEAMTLGQRVAVMRHGVVQQVDTPPRLYHKPANTFVAGFIGSPPMNFVEGVVDGGHLQLGGYRLRLPETLQAQLGDRSGAVLAGFRPEHLLDARRTRARGKPTVSAEVELTEDLGPETFAYFRIDGLDAAEVSERSMELGGAFAARLEASSGATAGQGMTLALDVASIQLFDPVSGRRLVE
jgi:multiple sugar transport system ATP-binding protein